MIKARLKYKYRWCSVYVGDYIYGDDGEMYRVVYLYNANDRDDFIEAVVSQVDSTRIHPDSVNSGVVLYF